MAKASMLGDYFRELAGKGARAENVRGNCKYDEVKDEQRLRETRRSGLSGHLPKRPFEAIVIARVEIPIIPTLRLIKAMIQAKFSH